MTNATAPKSSPPVEGGSQPGVSAAGSLSVGARVEVRAHAGTRFEARGKAALVLAIVAREDQAERRRLALMLWPDSPEQQARNNLRTLLHRLNQRFGSELLVGTDNIRIDLVQAQVMFPDSDELLALLQAGGASRCELLAEADIDAEACEELVAWLESARQRFRHDQLTQLRDELAETLARQQPERAIALARACVQLEPLSEQWHRQLMETLVRCGDRAAALAAYEECSARLRHHLGVLPDVQTRAVHLRILQSEVQGAAPPESVTAGLTPLGGAARYPLVERAAALSQVQAALARGQQVAVQGEPGVGKTRLLGQLALGEQGEQVSIRSGAREEPYAAIAQIIQEVQPRRAPRIGACEQAELARFAPLVFPGVQPSQGSLSVSRLHAALQHWLGRLGERGVRVLVLDDLHYADAASQAAIGTLLRAGASEPAMPLLLLAHRSAEIDATLSEALLSAQVNHQACNVTLQRLTLDGVKDLLRAMERAPKDSARLQVMAECLHQRTGGNPLFAIELAQHALEQPGKANFGAAESNIGALLCARLADSSTAAQQLAAVAAVAGGDFSVELAATVTDESALALMPAWSELQQRGLFANHGLAHDLVRDAAFAMLPRAIRQLLHRQVAAYLEGLGQAGLPVLQHWLAGHDFDRALPHAVRQLHAASAAGLSALSHEVEVLGLLERVSDATLLRNVWASAEVSGSYHEFVPPDVWPRMSALVDRVQRLDCADQSVGAWIAFERARILYCRDRAMRAAYDLLSGAVERMEPCGVERARSELVLSDIARLAGRSSGHHARRAKEAAADLTNDVAHLRLLNYIEVMLADAFTPLESIKRAATKMRQARRTGDPGLIGATRYEIAATLYSMGKSRSAGRYYFGAGSVRHANAVKDPLSEGHVALDTGRFDIATECFEGFSRSGPAHLRALYLSLIALRLGQWVQARQLLGEVDIREIRELPQRVHALALVGSELDRVEGRSPLPALQAAIDTMREGGVAGVGLDLLSWRVLRHGRPPEWLAATGNALLEAVRDNNRPTWFAVTMLEVAEAFADAGAAEARARALEAARVLRRGCYSHLMYPPDGLVRCAGLLEATDPAEASLLRQLARRWVLDALPHVPESARASFIHEVAVNRALLSDDPTP